MSTDSAVLAKAEAEQDEGMKALRTGEYEKAVELLGKSLEKRVKVHGDLAPECAFTYFKYGCALFYKSQEEADVLGSSAARAAAEAQGEKSVAAEKEKAQLQDAKGKGPAPSECDDEDEDSESENSEQEEDLEDGNQGDDEANEGDLALAWDVLETARLIYSKMPVRTLEEADIIMTLADVSLEKEDFAACIADYHHALSLLHELVPPHSRRMAEAYFRLCLAQQTAQQPSEALQSCRKAIESCNLCKAHLKAQIGALEQPMQPEDGSTAPAAHAGGTALGSSEPEVAKGYPPEQVPLDNAPASLGPSGNSAPSLKLEELQAELAEVEDVISDLKEKESEIEESLAHPFIQNLLSTTPAKQTTAMEPGAPSTPDTAACSLGPTGPSPSNNPGSATTASGQGGRLTLGTKAPTTQEPVAVVGRGRKRIAPTPVDAALDCGKRLC